MEKYKILKEVEGTELVIKHARNLMNAYLDERHSKEIRNNVYQRICEICETLEMLGIVENAAEFQNEIFGEALDERETR